MTDDQICNVFVLWTGSSARSILAQALVNKAGKTDKGPS